MTQFLAGFEAAKTPAAGGVTDEIGRRATSQLGGHAGGLPRRGFSSRPAAARDILPSSTISAPGWAETGGDQSRCTALTRTARRPTGGPRGLGRDGWGGFSLVGGVPPGPVPPTGTTDDPPQHRRCREHTTDDAGQPATGSWASKGAGNGDLDAAGFPEGRRGTGRDDRLPSARAAATRQGPAIDYAHRHRAMKARKGALLPVGA